MTETSGHWQYAIERAIEGANDAKGITAATQAADAAREARRVAISQSAETLSRPLVKLPQAPAPKAK